MPSRIKQRTGTNEKSSTHAVGLAPPVRRVVKQKSDGALNGSHSPNGRPRPSVTTTGTDVGIKISLTHTSTPSPTSDGPIVNELTPDAAMGASQSTSDGTGRCTQGSSDDDLEAHGAGCADMQHHTGNGSPFKIDVKAGGNSTASKHVFSNQKTVFATATTILKACPLWDVVAILIILLQLPPTIISIVQFLFAFLTFVSPTSGTSIANMPSINDVLMGVSGAPSFQTVVFLDILMFLPFLFLWTPAQNLALDLAQAVIAISLGGAASSRGGTSACISSCIVIIGLSHVVRWDFARQSGIHLVWQGLVKAGLRTANPPSMTSRSPDRLNASHGLARKLVGVHILAQGVTRLVRRWYISNELSANKKTDADSGMLSALNTPRAAVFAEPGTEPISNNSTDSRAPGPSLALTKEDAASRNKRKKKQANFVRSAQPFWAALANAKVTFLKELEHQQASSDAVGANAVDTGDIGCADFQSGGDRVWIMEVGHSEISFGVSLATVVLQDEEEDNDVPDHCDAGFRVRLNKTDWSSTRIAEQSLGLEIGEGKVNVWSGKIFGLTASTNYICEFVRVDDGAIIFTTHITTQPAPFTEQASTPSVKPQSLRPLSPTTTLRNSIQAAEAKLESHRNRLRRNKREHKNTVTSLQKEVDSLHGRLSSNGGQDDRLRQKVRQLEQNLQQARAKENEILEEIANANEIPAAERQEYNKKRAEWQREKDRRTEAQRELDVVKADTDREAAQLKAEILGLAQKRHKFEQRKAKFQEQRGKLLSEANESQEAQSRRYHEREVEARNRSETERRFIEQTANLESDTQTLWAKGGQYENHARQLEEIYNVNSQHLSVPTTPEGPLPGTRGLTQGIQHQNTFPGLQPGFQFSNAQALPDPAIMSGNQNSDTMYSLYRDGRGRSSSMLSGMSGFTDELDENPLPPHHQFSAYHSSNPVGVIGNGSRKSSAGSRGSTSTGSNNSSTRDPVSPPPKLLSPISKSFQSPISPPSTTHTRH